jgi:ribonuclease E
MAATATASWPFRKSTRLLPDPKEDREALLARSRACAEEERLRAAEDSRYEDRDHDQDEDEPALAQDVHADDSEIEEGEHGDDAPPPQPEAAESAPEENAADELRRKRQNLRRRYKIQDVIRRRQVLLVQVVKEERGNKGAALTTYLSLAGRYCVLMPNTSHGGGISRKISNGADRKRLKSIMADLNLPKTMGCIVRTAGLSRTKTEIKRDFDYLARLWDEIREKTLKSDAPALIYQDSDLIKRAIRDIYNRDIDEVMVEGDEGYKAARSFMKLLMPSHVKKVQQYADTVPLFSATGVEDQLTGMYQPLVQLKSGGYLVINPTEALCRSTSTPAAPPASTISSRPHTPTNIEAAHEMRGSFGFATWQGLVVIDFIDMESNGHIRKVEKAMKDALKNDRARIQVGRISSFGLMEMSRQRLRTGVLEASTKPCPHCEGSGLMRTASSAGLSALRMLEEEAARGRGSRIILRAGREAAIYVLNRKRHEIAEVEERYGVIVEVLIDESFEGAKMSVESLGPPPVQRPRIETVSVPAVEEEEFLDEEEDEVEEEPEEEEEEAQQQERRPARPQFDEGSEAERGRKRRRRRGRRGGRRRDGTEEGDNRQSEDVSEHRNEVIAEEASAEVAAIQEPAPEAPAAAEGDEEQPRKSRRRPRARRKPEGEADAAPAAAPAEPTSVEEPAQEAVVAEAPPVEAAANAEEPPAKPKRTRRKKAEPQAEAPAPAPEPATPQAANDEGGAVEPPPASPTRPRGRKAAAAARRRRCSSGRKPATMRPLPRIMRIPARPGVAGGSGRSAGDRIWPHRGRLLGSRSRCGFHHRFRRGRE